MKQQEEFYDMQIEMAAGGCISGTLSEWPGLNAALHHHNIDLPPSTPASELRTACRDLLEVQPMLRVIESGTKEAQR